MYVDAVSGQEPPSPFGGCLPQHLGHGLTSPGSIQERRALPLPYEVTVATQQRPQRRLAVTMTVSSHAYVR